VTRLTAALEFDRRAFRSASPLEGVRCAVSARSAAQFVGACTV
jgi:hypothetical protein